MVDGSIQRSSMREISGASSLGSLIQILVVGSVFFSTSIKVGGRITAQVADAADNPVAELLGKVAPEVGGGVVNGGRVIKVHGEGGLNVLGTDRGAKGKGALGCMVLDSQQLDRRTKTAKHNEE